MEGAEAGELGILGNLVCWVQEETHKGKSDLGESGETGRDWITWSFVGHRCERSRFYPTYDRTAVEGF